MVTKRLRTSVLLAMAVFILGSCAATEHDRPQLINFDTDHNGGVILHRASDVAKLTGTPEGFRQFMAGVIDTNLHWGELDKPCPTTITVEKYDRSGYALGSIGDCGGAVLMWGKWHGVWQQVWGGQAIPDCADLKKHSIPVSIAGNTCQAGLKAVPYTG
jgi:hypothetical protein